MNKQNKPKSKLNLQLMSVILVVMVSRFSSCGRIIKRISDIDIPRPRQFDPPPTSTITRTTDYGKDLIKIISTADNVQTLPNGIKIIKLKDGDYGGEIIRNTDNLIIKGGLLPDDKINIKLYKSNTFLVKKIDNYLILHEDILPEKYLYELILEPSTLVVIPNKNVIYYDELERGRKLAIQEAADKAAQKAVQEAVLNGVHSESMEILAKEAAKEATIAEVQEQTGYTTIVLISAIQMEIIVTQASQEAIEENTNIKEK